MSLLLAPLLLEGAGAPSVEEVRECYGWRFCELSYRTATACETLLLLTDGPHQCFLRPATREPTGRHRVLVPLVTGRALRYSIVLEDGSRTAPRELRAALATKPSLEVRQEAGRDDGLDLLASAGVESRWTLELGDGRRLTLPVDPDARASSVRIPLGRLEPEARVERAELRAQALDLSLSRPVGPLLGNAALARAFADAVDRLGVERLLELAADGATTAGGFQQAFRERAQETGLAPILAPATSRAIALVANEALVGKGLTIPFSRALSRLGNLDWMARLRGWTPVAGVEEPQAALAWAPGERPAPGPSCEAYARDHQPTATMAVGLGNVGRGPAGYSFKDLSDPLRLLALAEEVEGQLPPTALLLGALGHVQLALWGVIAIEPGCLGPPDGAVTVRADVTSLAPGCALVLRLNDQVMIPLRPGPPPLHSPGGGVGKSDRNARAVGPGHGWFSCTTSNRLFKPGPNTWVLTGEGLTRGRGGGVTFLLRQLSVGRPSPAR